MHRATARRLAALLLAAAPLAPVRAEPPALIPREILFGNPERAGPQISPDGKRLAWLAPDERNVLQVWVKSLDREDARKVTADKRRGIRRYLWAQDDRTLLYLQDSDGDENWHLYGVDLESGNVRDYTPFQGVRVEDAWASHAVRDRVQVGLNLRDRKVFDVHLVDLATGAVTLDTRNPGDVVGWDFSDDLVVRGAHAALPDGGEEIRVRGTAQDPWKALLRAPFGEQVEIVDLAADHRSVYLRTSLGSDTARVVRRDLASGTETVLAENPRVDAGSVEVNPRTHLVEAVDFPAGRQAWKVIDPAVRADYDGIRKLSSGDYEVESRDREDRTWIVKFTEDRGPVRYYSWDRTARKGTFLFSARPRLEGFPLAEMRPVVIRARDGLELNGYLTLPAGVPPKNLPLVLDVHGGPWARDVWGFDAEAQWLANRGYAVLQVNYRGSTGYGKKFMNAGNRQWGRAMHDDLVDAVRWAVKQGHADPKRVAIYGGSYGGYSALAGAAFTPDLFRCSVDIVGPSSIFTLMASIPPYWEPLLAMFKKRVGDPGDPADEKLLRAASPLFSAEKIRIPMLIAQGANDPRVKQAESEQIVAAIEKHGGRATYVLYTDEGHGFARPENRMDFYGRAEAFLAECLGGRAEPTTGERFPGSTAVLRLVGAR